MRKHLQTRVLTPLVLAIWIGVALQYLGGLSWAETSAASPVLEASFISSSQVPYRLLLNYSDPFRSNLVEGETYLGGQGRSAALGTVAQPKLISQKKVKNLPMQYKGLVKGQERNQATVLITWEGQVLSLQLGDSLSGFRIVGILEDRLQVQWRDSLWWLPKQ